MDEIQQLAEPSPVVEAASSPLTVPTPPATPSSNVGDDDLTYRHVPLQAAGTRRVRYGQIEPLRPRSFEYDEDDV